MASRFIVLFLLLFRLLRDHFVIRLDRLPVVARDGLLLALGELVGELLGQLAPIALFEPLRVGAELVVEAWSVGLCAAERLLALRLAEEAAGGLRHPLLCAALAHGCLGRLGRLGHCSSRSGWRAWLPLPLSLLGRRLSGLAGLPLLRLPSLGRLFARCWSGSVELLVERIQRTSHRLLFRGRRWLARIRLPGLRLAGLRLAGLRLACLRLTSLRLACLRLACLRLTCLRLPGLRFACLWLACLRLALRGLAGGGRWLLAALLGVL